MRKTMLRNCMIFGLMMVLIGIPNTAAEEQQEYDATVSFRFYADEDHGYEVKVQSFQVPDNWPENEPFKVQVEFDYHIGLDEADNILYDVWWGGHILLQGGGKLQPPDWHHIAYVNPYEWEPGVGDKETFYKTFKGLSGPCYFEAYCWMIYYVYVWDDIHQEWDYWKSDDPSDKEFKTISFAFDDDPEYPDPGYPDEPVDPDPGYPDEPETFL